MIDRASRRARIAEGCRTFLRDAATHEREGRLPQAWASLESAHILGQSATGLHVRSHVAMLGLAWRTRDGRELAGQLSRILGAALATWIWIPTGNTGRANVSAFRRMPIREDLQRLLEGSPGEP